MASTTKRFKSNNTSEDIVSQSDSKMIPTSSLSRLERLPRSLYEEVSSYLDVKSVAAFSRTSIFVRGAASKTRFWKSYQMQSTAFYLYQQLSSARCDLHTFFHRRLTELLSSVNPAENIWSNFYYVCLNFYSVKRNMADVARYLETAIRAKDHKAVNFYISLARTDRYATEALHDASGADVDDGQMKLTNLIVPYLIDLYTQAPTMQLAMDIAYLCVEVSDARNAQNCVVDCKSEGKAWYEKAINHGGFNEQIIAGLVLDLDINSDDTEEARSLLEQRLLGQFNDNPSLKSAYLVSYFYSKVFNPRGNIIWLQEALKYYQSQSQAASGLTHDDKVWAGKLMLELREIHTSKAAIFPIPRFKDFSDQEQEAAEKALLDLIEDSNEKVKNLKRCFLEDGCFFSLRQLADKILLEDNWYSRPENVWWIQTLVLSCDAGSSDLCKQYALALINQTVALENGYRTCALVMVSILDRSAIFTGEAESIVILEATDPATMERYIQAGKEQGLYRDIMGIELNKLSELREQRKEEKLGVSSVSSLRRS